MSGPSFGGAVRVVAPRGRETAVVVEVPHAGLALDAETLATLVAPAQAIGRDADLFVDELYADAPDVGATLFLAPMSRYVVDLNRAETDVDESTVLGGGNAVRATRGLVWRLTSDGAAAIAAPLSRVEVDRRLALYYRPYHRALAQLLEEKVARFGWAVLLAAHSMPSTGRAAHGDPNEVRADVVPGTRGRTSARPAFIDAVDAHARAAGLTIAHDTPYRGGYATAHYGRPDLGVHAVQVELARRLYMNEETLQRAPEAFAKMRAFCTGLVERLGAVRP
jgi:N-formylglutamate amidohydrolase